MNSRRDEIIGAFLIGVPCAILFNLNFNTDHHFAISTFSGLIIGAVSHAVVRAIREL